MHLLDLARSGELSFSPGIAESGSGSGCLDRSMPMPFGAVMDPPGAGHEGC